MINPALFVGLGSTGLKILEKLQGLVLEEYGVSSLPIFRYVAFETDQSVNTIQDSRIVLIHPIITSTDAVKAAIKRGERNYDWLDASVLNIPDGMFVSGAGNIRTAGRLCLWENWQSLASDRTKPGCAAVLQSAHDTIIASENKTKTTQMLGKIYSEWSKSIPASGIEIDPNTNVYIVGTFCGGTCGGMFIDIAYYVKHLFGLWQKDIGGQRAKVIGVFTVYDANDLNAATSDTAKNHSANCWASLLEYDYYCHRISRYQSIFPDGTIIDTNEKPLDYLYLLSCSGNRTNLRTENGAPDKDSLANMAATVLFSETVEGLLGQKERIRIDRLGKPRALTANKNQHMASLATCGFATFRYPKYRVVEGAACKYAIDLCQGWIGTKLPSNQATAISGEANSIWNMIEKDSRDILIHSPKGVLKDQVKEWFDRKRDELIGMSPEEITKMIRREFEQFGEGRLYDQHICARQKELKDGLKEGDKIVKGILGLLNDEIIKKLNEKKNINYVKEFVAKIDSAIEDTIRKEEPKKYPAPDLSKAAEDLMPDFWAKSVGKAKDISKEKKQDYLEEMKEEFISHIEKIRDYRIKSVLEEVRQEIGVGKQPPEDWLRSGKRSIKQELDNLERILDTCTENFQKKFQEMSTVPGKTQEVVIITKGKDISEDLQNLYSTLNIRGDNATMLRKAKTKEIGGQEVEIDFHKWLGYREPRRDIDDLTRSILDAVREEALQQRERFTIAAEVLRRSNALGVNLCQFVENSLPHLQLKGDLASITTGNPPEFIGSKDEDVNATQMKNLYKELKKCPNPVEFDEQFITHLDELDHLLFFYKEESLIYMDENLSTSELFTKRYHDYENFLKTQRDSPCRTVHTHRLGRAYFDVWIVIRREEATKLVQIAKEIFSTRDEKSNWKDSEIFVIANKSLNLKFKLPDGCNEVIEGTTKGIERLAQNKDSFEYFENLVKEKAKEVGRIGFIERVNILADWFEKDAERKGDPDAIEVGNRKRDEFLKKDNPDRLIEICFPKEDEKENDNE